MKLDISSVGYPGPEGHRHHRLREGLALAAALAGAFGILGAIFLLIGTVSPAQAAVAYGAVIVLLIVWLTGIWWRWDSPDRRDPAFERERRGF